MSTTFLDSLTPANETDEQARVAEHYLRTVKGIEDAHQSCLGYTEDEDNARFYYYTIEGGVLEIWVFPDGNGSFNRRVTDFIVDPAEIQEMLGSDATSSR